MWMIGQRTTIDHWSRVGGMGCRATPLSRGIPGNPETRELESNLQPIYGTGNSVDFMSDIAAVHGFHFMQYSVAQS